MLAGPPWFLTDPRQVAGMTSRWVVDVLFHARNKDGTLRRRQAPAPTPRPPGRAEVLAGWCRARGFEEYRIPGEVRRILEEEAGRANQ